MIFGNEASFESKRVSSTMPVRYFPFADICFYSKLSITPKIENFRDCQGSTFRLFWMHLWLIKCSVLEYLLWQADLNLHQSFGKQLTHCWPICNACLRNTIFWQRYMSSLKAGFLEIFYFIGIYIVRIERMCLLYEWKKIDRQICGTVSEIDGL